MSKLKNETIFEFGQGFGQGFTVIPNEILNDSRLSYKALGIYVQILQFQNSKEHKIYMSSLQKLKKDGETSITQGMKELIDLGYIERIRVRNEKGHVQGMKYIVHVKPIENTTFSPIRENPVLENPELENHVHKKKIEKKENKKKENNVVVVADEKETQLLDLYKTFKLEKRVMPHTIKLLKEYTNKFDIEVFEQVFISASEEDVKKKYAYIKATLEELDKKNIRNIKDYEQDKETYKAKLEAKKNTSRTKGSNQVKTNKAHNVNNTFKKYEEKELEKLLKENQETKFVKVEEAAANENKESEFDIFGHFIKSKSSEEYFNALPEDIKNKVISLVDFDNKIVFIPKHIKDYANRI